MPNNSLGENNFPQVDRPGGNGADPDFAILRELDGHIGINDDASGDLTDRSNPHTPKG